MNIKEKITVHQQKIALSLGMIAVGAIGFYGGRSINSNPSTQSPIFSTTTNYTETAPATQTGIPDAKAAAASTAASGEPLNCEGKIKGSASHKYHLPGGSFYKKTTRPIACFDTEAEAKAAGFIKSAK